MTMDFSLETGCEVLRATPDVLRSLLGNLSDGWITGDVGPKTWSPYQVVGHLTHIEESDWIDRTRVILESGTAGVFEPIDREAGFARFAGWTLGALLDRFTGLRTANLATLESLVTAGDLRRRGTHPDFGAVTLSQLLAAWVVHDLNHLGQIVTTMAAQYREAAGPWRAYLPILDAT